MSTMAEGAVGTRGRCGVHAVRRSGPSSRSIDRKQRSGVEREKERRGVTIDDEAGHRARVADGARACGVTVTCGAERSMSLVFFSFPYLTVATER